MEFDWSGATVIAGMGLLTYYRIKRKFKKGKPKNLWDRLERNWVEIVINCAMFPGAADIALKWINKL